MAMLYVVDNSHSDKWIHFVLKIESVLPKIPVQLAGAQLRQLTSPYN